MFEKSASAYPYLWLTDPDSDQLLLWPSRRQQKLRFFASYFLNLHLHQFSKIKCHQEVAKQQKSRFFLTIFAWWRKDPYPNLLTNLDSGGQKTHGSGTPLKIKQKTGSKSKKSINFMAISWNNISVLCFAFLLFANKLQPPRGLFGHPPAGGQLKVVMAHFLNSPHTCVGQLRHLRLQCCGSGMIFIFLRLRIRIRLWWEFRLQI